jgi:hypothetical protein
LARDVETRAKRGALRWTGVGRGQHSPCDASIAGGKLHVVPSIPIERLDFVTGEIMATLVPMKADQGTVSVRLTITGIVLWHYTYVSRDATRADSGTSNAPITFELGQPDRLSHEIDSWRIAATNQTGADVGYSAVIEWLQAGSVIAIWRDPSDGATTVKSGEAVVSDGDAFLVAQ